MVIGTGFAGLGMAMKLRRAGIDDFALIEMESDVGGTWLVNDYPGCACDVQSHMYSFSFEPNPDWSREFSRQPEILAYLRRCADKYRLRPQIQFGTRVVSAAYDEPRAFWRVKLADAAEMRAFCERRGLKPGDAVPSADPEHPATREITARVVVSGMGGLSTPAYPRLKGIERFQGKTFHSQRWDHSYDLSGKRVAVIGTGASAIQFVPAIQSRVAHLDLYQRTAPWILPKPDRAIGDGERQWFRRVPALRWLRRARLYATLESRALAFVVKPSLTKQVENWGHQFIRHQVKDETLRAKVTPTFSAGCKRVLMSWDYYPALAQPNVEVVTDGIAEVREHSIVGDDGVERPVDVIIYGTGFRIGDLMPRGTLFGRGGKDIVDAWPHGPEAYKGTTVAGFPNLFLLVGPNTGLGHNSIVFMIESQIEYVLSALRTMKAAGVDSVEVRREAQDAYNDRLQVRSRRTIWTTGGCKSYYLHPETGRNLALWPDFTFVFRYITRKFDSGNYVFARGQAAPRVPSNATCPSSSFA